MESHLEIADIPVTSSVSCYINATHRNNVVKHLGGIKNLLVSLRNDYVTVLK